MLYIILVGVAGDRVLGRYSRVNNFNNKWWHMWTLVQMSVRQPPGFPDRVANLCIHNQRGRSKTPKLSFSVLPLTVRYFQNHFRKWFLRAAGPVHKSRWCKSNVWMNVLQSAKTLGRPIHASTLFLSNAIP